MSHPPSTLVAELAGVRGQVTDMAQTLWAAREGGELMELVAEVEALKASLDALELQVVRELDATGAVKAVGWASTQDFLTHTTGGHKGTGPAMVRLATAVTEPALAPVAEAMGDGWLSTTKAHVIERAVDRLPGDRALRARGVQVLLDDAKRLDATELKKVALHLVTVVDPDGDERRDEKALDRLERAAHHSRNLSITDDQAGGAWIKGRCSSEDAAMLKATLIPLAAPVPTDAPTCHSDSCAVPGCGHDGRDPRDHGARMLDALVEACRLLQTTEVLPESHGAVPRLTLTMDLRAAAPLSGLGETDTGEQSSPPPRSDACAATPRSSPPSSAPSPTSSTSDDSSDSPPLRSGEHSSPATNTAASRTAPDRRSCATPTTSATGCTAARRPWQTCSSSAATTTA